MSEATREKDYVIVIQCHQVTHHACPGFHCEYAFNERIGGFSRYPQDQRLRYISISCGGCPGQPVLRKLTNFKKCLRKREKRDWSGTVVHLSTCITRNNHHGPRCPHIDYIKGQIARAGFDDVVEDTRISPAAEKRREEGGYCD